MEITSRIRKYFSQNVVLVVLIFFLALIFFYTGVFNYVNWRLFDLLVTINRSTPVHKDNVVFVCIDQKSINFFDENTGNGWPWPREFYGRLVRYLSECGAKAIVFDVIFSEPDIERAELTGENSDNEFADAIRESGITYLAVSGEEGTYTESVTRDIPFFLKDSTPFQHIPDLAEYKSAVFPLKKFYEGARGIGLVNLDPEDDGIHRRYPLVSKIGGNYMPSIAYAVVKNILGEEELKRRILDRIGREAFIDNEGQFFLNWYGEGGTGRGGEKTDAVFRYYSYHAVWASDIQEERGEKPIISRETFRNKIIIIGSNASGLLDLKATPFTYQTIYPGMEIHATAIENMLSGEFIYRIPSWLLILCMAAIAAALYGIERFFKSLRVFIAASVLLMVCELAISYLFLIFQNRWISAAGILGTTLFVFSGLIISGYFNERKEKRLLRGHFGRYVNEAVLRDILANPNSVNFQGRNIIATIMATDIANFTGISESLKPDKVVALLNDYLSEVSETLIDNGAFINKYIGDAILALYGAFGEQDHMKKSCLAALQAQKIITKKVKDAVRGNEPKLITRMGITTGEMTMGNIGSARKIEYTVIGDTVNTAFRLEGLNKFYKTIIIVSEHTKEGAGDDFEFRLLDKLKVKGKETSEQVFELLGMKGSVDPARLQLRDEFEEALKLYQTRRFTEAREIFSRLKDEGDETSGVFVERCNDFIKEPPPPDWNGVWVMLRK